MWDMVTCMQYVDDVYISESKHCYNVRVNKLSDQACVRKPFQLCNPNRCGETDHGCGETGDRRQALTDDERSSRGWPGRANIVWAKHKTRQMGSLAGERWL